MMVDRHSINQHRAKCRKTIHFQSCETVDIARGEAILCRQFVR